MLQQKLDTNKSHITAMEMIANKIDGVTFLPMAIESDDSRLIQLAAKKIQNQPHLLDSFNVSDPNWLNICIECIKLDTDIWTYIGIPTGLIYELLDQIINGLTINKNVYTLLKEYGFVDLSEYPQRALIWRHLDANVKNSFLNATAMGCIKLIDQKIIRLSSLESEITNTISENDFIKQLILDETISVSIKIRLFISFKKLNEDNCNHLIQQCQFSTTESGDLGELILDRKWKKAAKLCKDLNKEKFRSDLNVATQKIKSLLKMTSVLDKLKERWNWTDNDLERLEDKKFQVALSFPGEKRTYVKTVADYLLDGLERHDVFYDNNFKHLISQPNADTILQKIYRHNAELIVVFLSSEYDEKQWCGLEWRAIKDMIKHKGEQKIMLIRFDNQQIDGLFSIDGYIDANTHNEEAIAKLILHRLAVLLEASEKTIKG